MILYFADRKMNILGQASTTLPGGYIITDDHRIEDTDSGVSTFSCRISFDNKSRAELEAMADAGNYLLKSSGRINEFYTIIDAEIDTKAKEVYIYAEDAGLDLINEIVGEFEASESQPSEWYINKYITDSGFVIGINEIPKSTTRKLKWEGEESVTSRLASIATQFGGYEISYSFDVKNLQITNKYVNIHKQRGQDRGVTLYLNRDIDRIITSRSVANLVTAFLCEGGVPDNKDKAITFSSEKFSYDDGDFFVDGDKLKSRKANEKWSRYLWSQEPNQVKAGEGYIVKPYSYNTTSASTLCSHAIAELKKVCDMEINYEIDIKKLPEGVRIGDRVNIVDNAGKMYVSTRILQLETSETGNKHTATLGDHIIKRSGIAQKIAELAEQFAQNAVSVQNAIKVAERAEGLASEAQSAADEAAEKVIEANKAVEDAIKAATDATEAASVATEAAQSAAGAVSKVETSVESIKTTVENAQKAVEDAEKAAETAESKAEDAETAAENAEKAANDAATAAAATTPLAQNAVTMANNAIETAETAINNANNAIETANAAKGDAEQAKSDIATWAQNLETYKQTVSADYARKTELTETQTSLQAQITSNANQLVIEHEKLVIIDETANSARDSAELAQGAADAARGSADKANEYATQASERAEQAAAAAATAQSEAETAYRAYVTASEEVDTAQTNLNKARRDLTIIEGNLDSTEEEIAAARQALAEAEEAHKSAKTKCDSALRVAQNAISEANEAATKSTQAQAAAETARIAAQNAETVAETVNANTKKANDAFQAASAAQNTADRAVANAQAAQDKANEAAGAAQKANDDLATANQTLSQAQEDLKKAENALTEVTGKVGAAEEEIEAAKENLAKAQEAADKAKADAATAQEAADKAKADAAAAQGDADKANAAAAAAQKAADDAAAAAKAAQDAVDALAVRVSLNETEIVKSNTEISLRATKKEVEDIQIGGRNLLIGTANGVGWTYDTFGIELRTFVKSNSTTSENYIYCNNEFDLEPGQEYTLSFKAKRNGYLSSMDVYILPKTFATTGIAFNRTGISLSEEYTSIALTFIPNTNATNLNDCCLRFDNNGSTANGTEASLYIKDVKLEKGNKATDWTYAPEDLLNPIIAAQATADQAARNYEQHEAQIQLLADSISNLVRGNDGGTLVRQDENGLYYFDITNIEKNISDVSVNVNELTGIVRDANGDIDVLASTAAALAQRVEYVRSYTDKNGQPCLELGEGDSTFKVRITNTEIQFEEDGVIPAKINRKMLIIEKTIIKGDLQFGDVEGTLPVWIWQRRANGNLGLVRR